MKPTERKAINDQPLMCLVPSTTLSDNKTNVIATLFGIRDYLAKLHGCFSSRHPTVLNSCFFRAFLTMFSLSRYHCYA